LTAQALAGLVTLAEKGTISSSVAKEVFAKMFESGRSADEIVQAEGLAQTSDEGALLAIVREVLAQNADAIAQVRAGRNNAFGFLVGQAMKASKGKGNPKVLNELLRKELDAS
jgi:aspartyl-tRNA(Asn)/glutamyl-tRNA(Gln) amidotransferase subunit B